MCTCTLYYLYSEPVSVKGTCNTVPVQCNCNCTVKLYFVTVLAAPLPVPLQFNCIVYLNSVSVPVQCNYITVYLYLNHWCYTCFDKNSCLKEWTSFLYSIIKCAVYLYFTVPVATLPLCLQFNCIVYLYSVLISLYHCSCSFTVNLYLYS